MTFTRSAAALLAVVASTSAAWAAPHATAPGPTIIVRQAWARPVPAGLTNGVVYAVLANTGATPDRLLSAATPVARAASLHESGMSAGMIHMAPVAALPVPAHGEARLAPGGFHLMLEGVHAPLKAGTRFPVTLTFARAGLVRTEVVVGYSPPGG